MGVTFSPAVQRKLAGFDHPVWWALSDEELGAEDGEVCVHMGQRNAGLVLEALGVDPDDEGWCGGFSVDDLEGRLLLATGLALRDEGRPAYSDGNWHVCERPAGYLQGKLAELDGLLSWCRTRGFGRISWG